MSSLYDRLGGQASLDTAVDIFYDKVLSDSTINHFFSSISMDRQKSMLAAFLTVAFGGPNNYSGKDLRTAHQHLNLQEAHFQAVAGHLGSTLEELKVPDNLIKEVMAIVASTRDDILNLTIA